METFFANKEAYPVLILLVIGISVVIPFIAQYWYKTRRAEMELGLKQAMVERGMSAADICAVIEAGKSGQPETTTELPAAADIRARA
jgi:hypothetical protein